MRIVLLGIATLVACIQVKSEVVVCSADWTCPPESECNEQFHLCVSKAQRAACEGKPDGEVCELTAADEVCYSGICIPDVCGDEILSPGEVCDDGNVLDGDGCAANCRSNETCGNGLVDLVLGEECDFGNQLDSDGCSSTCGLEAPEWTERPTGPRPRMAAQIAYDSARDRVVMVGGLAMTVTSGGLANTNLADAWEWDGRWRETKYLNPQVTDGSAMTYDSRRKRVVLLTPRLFNSSLTWELDGTTWKIVSQDGPRLFYSAMAYDPVSDRTVVFGGSHDDGIYTAEHWSWDGTAWTMLQTPTTGSIATGRRSAQLVFDPKRGNLLLFGGHPQAGTFFNDLWELVGTTWQQRSANGASGASIPTPRTNASMAWNTTCQCVVLFGGQTGASTVDNSTYTWNGSAWNKLATTTSPTASSFGAMASDGHGRNILFGGTKTGGPTPDTPNNYLSNTWIFDGSDWRVESPRIGSAVAVDGKRHRVVMFGGTPTIAGGYNDTLELTQLGWQLRSTTLGTTARLDWAAMTYDDARDEAVLAGGTRNFSTLEPGTWTWNGSVWSARTVATQMPPENNRVMAFDPDHSEVVAFGGSHPNPSNSSITVYTNETWTWNGTTWTSKNPTMSPSPRELSAAAYDRASHQIVLFGGRTASGWSAETWVWDGTAWTLKADAAPSTMVPMQPRMAWDPARRRLVLLTGDSLQTWEWESGSGQWLAVVTSRSLALPRDAVMFPSFDGGGIELVGGTYQTSIEQGPAWELRWNGATPHDDCRIATDDDRDGLAGCADPDCWHVCTPSCPPGESCGTSAPRCGDGTCDGFESCRSCPGDCTCGNVCGDGICDPGESCAGDCS